MKKFTVLFLTAALIFSLCGCRAAKPADTSASTQPTQTETSPSTAPTSDENPGTASTDASRILSAIWAAYGEEERFSVYGGMMESPTDNAPGDLDLTIADEIISKYLVPEEYLAQIEEGASIVHLMNSNLFTAAVFRLKSGSDMAAIAKALREAIQKNQWICGQPDKLLVAVPEADHLLVVFGSEDAMNTFEAKCAQVYPDAKIHYKEAVVA